MCEIEILYEDNHLLAACKPAGVPTQVSSHHEKALESVLKDLIKTRDQKKGNVFLHAIHRLDAPVKGIVLFAKSQKALTRLAEAQKKQQFTKHYQAIVEGEYALLSFPLLYLRKENFYAEVDKDPFPEAKEVQMDVRKLKILPEGTLLIVELKTGRYHQIRASLAYLGHPILGDEKYGAKTTYGKGIALVHTYLRFLHPVSGKCMELTIPFV